MKLHIVLLCVALVYLVQEFESIHADVGWRDVRKINFLNMFAKTKAGPLYLINGTLCRFVNSAPICTTLSTNGFFRNLTNNQQPIFNGNNNQQSIPTNNNNGQPINQNQFNNNQFPNQQQTSNQGFQPNQQPQQNQPQQQQQQNQPQQQQQQPNFG